MSDEEKGLEEEETQNIGSQTREGAQDGNPLTESGFAAPGLDLRGNNHRDSALHDLNRVSEDSCPFLKHVWIFSSKMCCRANKSSENTLPWQWGRNNSEWTLSLSLSVCLSLLSLSLFLG